MVGERAGVGPSRSATKPKKMPPAAAVINVRDMMPPATPADMCRSFCGAGMTIEYSITSMRSSIQPSDAANGALRRAGWAASCQKLGDCGVKISARDISSFRAALRLLNRCRTWSRRRLCRCSRNWSFGRVDQDWPITRHRPLDAIEELALCALDLELAI